MKAESVVQPTIPCAHCSRTFLSGNALQQHQKDTHNLPFPDRGIPCPDCSRTFRDTEGLLHHRRMKHKEQTRIRAMPEVLPDGRMRCPYCTAVLADQNAVYNHCKMKHRSRARAHLRVEQDHEESLAEIAIEARMKRDMGEPLDPLEESLLETWG